MHFGSYQRGNKYLYTVVDQPFDMFDLHMFFSNHFVQILYLFIHPPFLTIFMYSNQFVQLKFYFVRITRNSTVSNCSHETTIFLVLASSPSFYLRMYICTLYKSQVSESLHVPQFPHRTRCQSPKSENQTLVANSTAFA